MLEFSIPNACVNFQVVACVCFLLSYLSRSITTYFYYHYLFLLSFSGLSPACTGAWGYCLEDYALPLVELHEVRVLHYIQTVHVLLDGTKTVWCIINSFQLCVTSKMLEYSLEYSNTWIHSVPSSRSKIGLAPVLNPDVHCWYWPPTGFWMTDHHPLGLAIQAVFSPCLCRFIQPVYQLPCENLWETLSKALLKLSKAWLKYLHTEHKMEKKT